MKIKRILSMTFALVMLLGMAAGMSQTAYAEGNTTEITPTKTSGTMTITLTIAAAHSVTVTPGEHMTKTADSGEASQSNLSGAMADVVYTANDGYYFPTDYSVATVNGISVTRDGYTQITVSGTPTADAAITLTAPTAKTKPDAPTTAAAADCTTADNNDGKLTGVTTAMEYKKSDAADWTAGTDRDITGLAPGTYYVRVKATDTTLASDNQELTIKGFISYTVTFKVVNGSWNDEALTGEQTVTLTGHEGDTLKLAENQIPAVGGKPAANYKAGSWDTEPSTETAITAATTYTYSYAAKDSISQTVTFKVVNGSWDDGNTADITVTLTGLEGDTLKLAENQIPAVGTKPADTYKAGAWDVVPSTETAITAATTYTYTYAAKDGISQTVTFKVINGSWDDGNSADITVTLTGMEGDTLKLATNQIPAVGGKPNAGFEAGNWDVTPDTNTAITGNVTYIYSYAASQTQIIYTDESEPNQNHRLRKGNLIFTYKRNLDDQKTFSLFDKALVDNHELTADTDYTKAPGSLILTLKAAYLDTLTVGEHTLTVLFTDGKVDSRFIVSRALDPTRFEDVAVPSDSFTFKVVWKGGSDKNIDFTLYKKDGTVYHHGFDKKALGSGEWRYSAWFSSPEACYIIEKPMEGYQIRYENAGVYAQVTDRCCDGGVIIIHKVPKTGDNANLALWMSMVVIGAMTLCGVAVIGKRRKKSAAK